MQKWSQPVSEQMRVTVVYGPPALYWPWNLNFMWKNYISAILLIPTLQPFNKKDRQRQLWSLAFIVCQPSAHSSAIHWRLIWEIQFLASHPSILQTDFCGWQQVASWSKLTCNFYFKELIISSVFAAVFLCLTSVAGLTSCWSLSFVML
jgi:hypothetical protein